MAVFGVLLYVLDIVLCIVSIKKDNRKMYSCTKPFLMPFLLLSYFLLLPQSLRSADYQKFAYIALICHTLGDCLLLIPKTAFKHAKIMFFIGTFFFFVGHIMYILWFVSVDYPRQIVIGMVFALIVLIVEILFYKRLSSMSKKLALPLCLYSLSLGILLIEVSKLVINPDCLISLFGVILFVFSDYGIARREVKNPFAGQMTIMTTYIAGQTLIVLGMLLLQIK